MDKKLNFNKLSRHETPERSPGFLLWHVSTAWRSSIECVLKNHNLTHPQFVVLATIGWLTKNGEKAIQAGIGKMACLDPNTTSQIIKGLERKGLVIIERSDDARAKNPMLTTKGKIVLTQALPAVETTDHRFFSMLSMKEMEFLIKVFRKLTPG